MDIQKIKMPSCWPVTCHTKHVGEGSVFVAIQGEQQDGVNYILDALQKGAKEIVVQDGTELSDEIINQIATSEARLTFVPNAREVLATMSTRSAGDPSKQLKIIAITGTKGKTTTAYLLEYLLRASHHKTALISTVQNGICGNFWKSTLTTPQPDYLQQFLKVCVDSDVEYVVMEVSAQALSLHRVAGILFSGIIFTNFEMEHAEFYSSLEEYFKAKCLIFESRLSDAPVLINADDRRLHTLSSRYPIQWYGVETPAQFQGAFQGNQHDHVNLSISWQDNEYSFSCPSLIGKYNAYNCLAAVSMALSLGISTQSLVESLHTFGKIPGRMELYETPKGVKCIIDYAHTPASYEAVLSLLAGITNELIVVFGAGGNRDRSKRPKMGAIAAKYCHMLFLTSDNPRQEDPMDIINDIRAGIPPVDQPKVRCELDREAAIRSAHECAHPEGIIVILGKGPDEYQIIGSNILRFSESEIVQNL